MLWLFCTAPVSQTHHDLSGQLVHVVGIRSQTLVTDLVLQVVFLLQRFMAFQRNIGELLPIWAAFWSSQAHELLRAFGRVYPDSQKIVLFGYQVFLSLNSCSSRYTEKGGTFSPIVQKLYIRIAINKSKSPPSPLFKHKPNLQGCK